MTSAMGARRRALHYREVRPGASRHVFDLQARKPVKDTGDDLRATLFARGFDLSSGIIAAEAASEETVQVWGHGDLPLASQRTSNLPR
jgi:hypothetical protein